MDTTTKIRFLLQPNSLRLLSLLAQDSRDDLALAQSSLLRGFPVAERAALLEQRALRQRGAAKQGRAGEMVFTALGWMQMTSESLAHGKAKRLGERGIHTLADLCCGLGGDSMHLPDSMRVIGVDKDLGTLLAYRHNVALHRSVFAVQADAMQRPFQAQACLIDPARRAKAGGQHWNGEELMPGLNALLELVRRQKHVGIKLGPGLNPPEEFQEGEWEYLGLRDSCLELMVWCGDLGDSGLVRATEWPSGATLAASREEAAEAFRDFPQDDEEQPGSYLYEPVKCVVRAHLHALLAERMGLRLLDARIAYLTGDNRVDHPLLKRYALVRELSADLGEIKAAFRAADVGQVTVKKRGVPIVPEQVRAKVIRPGGSESATLIFTRVGQKRRVFWVKPEGLSQSVDDGEAGLSDDEFIPDR